jgi:hypothetical protein
MRLHQQDIQGQRPDTSLHHDPQHSQPNPASLLNCNLEIFVVWALLVAKPGLVESVHPEWTRGVCHRVVSLVLLGCRTIDAVSGGGILFACLWPNIVAGCSMWPATVRAADAFWSACGRVMAPPHAPSALSRARPGSSAPDLAGCTANDDGTYQCRSWHCCQRAYLRCRAMQHKCQHGGWCA